MNCLSDFSACIPWANRRQQYSPPVSPKQMQCKRTEKQQYSSQVSPKQMQCKRTENLLLAPRKPKKSSRQDMSNQSIAQQENNAGNESHNKQKLEERKQQFKTQLKESLLQHKISSNLKKK